MSKLSSLHDHKLYMFYSSSVLIKQRTQLCREVLARYLVKKCGALTAVTLYLAFSSGRANTMQNVKNLITFLPSVSISTANYIFFWKKVIIYPNRAQFQKMKLGYYISFAYYTM